MMKDCNSRIVIFIEEKDQRIDIRKAEEGQSHRYEVWYKSNALGEKRLTTSISSGGAYQDYEAAVRKYMKSTHINMRKRA